MLVLPLDAEEATQAELTGGKAAALARAQAAGLPTLPGIVLTTEFTDRLEAEDAGDGHRGDRTTGDGDTGDDDVARAIRQAFDYLEGDQRALVARSSSRAEDTETSSMAGQFESVIDVRGIDAFAIAVRKVIGSRHAVRSDAGIAVLCQPFLEPEWGGVLFGVDPVSGRSDRRVINAVHGGPHRLVNGEVAGSHTMLDERGNELEFVAGDGPRLPVQVQRQLLRLAAEAAETFGGPQDIEWAAGHDGELWLLQSRPVTSTVRGVPRGPVYGPGPVAETFPEPLKELEVDLWVWPLREAVREALLLAGSTTPARLAESEVVVSVRGHIAIDLNLAGVEDETSRLRRMDPRRSVRRLRTAWRVGRLRAALPGLAEVLLDRVDQDLESVPQVTELSSRQLVALIRRGQVVLRALHAHEILMGLLVDTTGNQLTGASVALRVLTEARLDGLSDAEIIARSPIVLALTAPKVRPVTELPQSSISLDSGADEGDSAPRAGLLREALRLRVRWLQELTGMAAWELGERIARAGGIDEAEQIRDLTLDQIDAFATKRGMTSPELIRRHVHDWGEPLPARFQLSDRGFPIAVRSGAGATGGTGAGGGVGQGPVTHDTQDPPAGSVLVTRTLSPSLAPLLSRLEGIVCETGSVLSHLAILAREAGIATVVGHADALEELQDGVQVRVDGTSGEVRVVDEGQP